MHKSAPDQFAMAPLTPSWEKGQGLRGYLSAESIPRTRRWNGHLITPARRTIRLCARPSSLLTPLPHWKEGNRKLSSVPMRLRVSSPYHL